MTKKRLTFERENGGWYIYMPMYPGPKHNLAMVAGADDMLDHLMRGHDDMKYISFDVYTDSKPTSLDSQIGFERTSFTLLGGAHYNAFGEDAIDNHGRKVEKIWLCPVTLVVYQHYPKFIQIDLNTIAYSKTPVTD